MSCAHGATVGQLDEDALFYLRTRGLSLLEAKEFLINAFAQENVDLLRNEQIGSNLQYLLHTKLQEIL